MSRRMMEYYSEHSISDFVLTVNGSRDEVAEFCKFVDRLGIRAKIFEKNSPTNNLLQARWSSQRQAFISANFNQADWKFSVDSDEIVYLGDGLLDLLSETDAEWFLAFMVDVIHRINGVGGDYENELFDERHNFYFLTQAVALAQKVPLARVSVLVGGAAHDVGRRFRGRKRFPGVLPLFHFKWGRSVFERLHQRFVAYQQLGIGFSEESMEFCELAKGRLTTFLVQDLHQARFSIGLDKTGGRSLRLDPQGDLSFFKLGIV